LAFQKGEDRFSKVAENGFRRFLMHLPITLNSMLPIDRVGLGFDQIDPEHYALGMPSAHTSYSAPVVDRG
jgi:hypothetical protein